MTIIVLVLVVVFGSMLNDVSAQLSSERAKLIEEAKKEGKVYSTDVLPTPAKLIQGHKLLFVNPVGADDYNRYNNEYHKYFR